jgi:hypothetical protein
MYCFDCHSPLRADEIDGFRPDLPPTSDARINFRWIYTQWNGEEVAPLCEDCFADLVEDEHCICDANCGKEVKSLDQYISYRGCIFCDEECLSNFTGDFPEEIPVVDNPTYCEECGEEADTQYCQRCQADIDTADSVIY